jgi:hypothetical protein
MFSLPKLGAADHRLAESGQDVQELPTLESVKSLQPIEEEKLKGVFSKFIREIREIGPSSPTSKFDNGFYCLGKAPKPNEDGEILFQVKLENNKVVEIQPISTVTSPQLQKIYKLSAEFIINGGRCCLKDEDPTDHENPNDDRYIYWLVPMDTRASTL